MIHTPTSSTPSRHIRIRIPQSIRPIARMATTARRTKPISRTRKLRSPSPTTVRTRRSAKAGIASVVLHVSHAESRGAFGGVVDVVLQGVAVTVLRVAESGALGEAAGDDREGEYHADDRRCDGVCGGFAQAFGLGVAGMEGEVGWGGCAGIECWAAVGCAHGADAGLDSAHDSGGHGHAEAGSCGIGVGCGWSSVVAARVDRVKMHGSDGCEGQPF